MLRRDARPARSMSRAPRAAYRYNRLGRVGARVPMSGPKTIRLTMAQALVRFLQSQYVERDGRELPFFAGVWGIFGHGNLAGIGQALQENPELRYYTARNEQAMVHAAAASARASNRLRTFACTSSIGPGATKMITAAAGATIKPPPA